MCLEHADHGCAYYSYTKSKQGQCTMFRSCATTVPGHPDTLTYPLHGDCGYFIENEVGMQKLSGMGMDRTQLRCSLPHDGGGDVVQIEATRCADMGPLALRRESFLGVGGFNESWSEVGAPGSVAAHSWVECITIRTSLPISPYNDP